MRECFRTFSMLTVVLALGGCESSPKSHPRPAPVPKTAAAQKPTVSIDGDALVRQAQLLRDREFVHPPKIVAVPAVDVRDRVRCVDECRNEENALVQVFFGGKAPASPQPPVASFDAKTNTVRWDQTQTDAARVRADVLRALVEALDHETGAPLGEVKSWDAQLALSAVAEGPGVFVAALHAAKKAQPRVDAKRLARRPDTLASLQGIAGLADNFATREGFALSAAMFRSGGWSAVEMLRNDPPTTTGEVVRPDRYLAGHDFGHWSWPARVTDARKAAGWVIGRQGRVGPGVFVEWLSRQVPAAQARAAYLSWESDTYRIWRKPDGSWIWEYLSLWNTPSNAEQIVTALTAGLKAQKKANYTVLRKGTTIAVVGSSAKLPNDAATAALLVSQSPVFQPDRSRGIAFVPTPLDRLQSRPRPLKIPAKAWKDPVTATSADLGPFADWKIQPTDDAGLLFFAKSPDGAVAEYLVEVPPLTRAPFADDAYRTAVATHFGETIDGKPKITARRVDQPLPGSLLVEADVAANDKQPARRLRAWQFHTGDYVVTLSLQAPVKVFDARVAQVSAVVSSLKPPKAATGKPRDKGIIKFEVE